MRLSSLIAALPAAHAPRELLRGESAEDPVIRGICVDSRSVAPGDLFFALRGSSVDGHRFVDQALRLGAAAVVVEELAPGLELRGRPALVVADSRRALAPIATRFFGDPSSELTLIGVTGTNGKTSTTYLLESILRAAGRSVGVIGTIEVRYGRERRRALNTTPESVDLQRTLRAMRNQGVDFVVMEVSSHGLELGRVEGCRYAVGAMTNVTQDHLDFHGTMEAYLDAKTRLFGRHLAPDGAAVVNLDDSSAESFLTTARQVGARVVRVSRDHDRGAEVTLEDADVRLDGSHARLRLPTGSLDVELPLVGEFNLENMLVACGCAVALGIAPDSIAAGLAAVPQVPGRVERITGGGAAEPTVLVDYAHTPDAVEKLLRTLRPLARGRLLTVFGCGGDRDRAKRPLMAEAVARWSDRVIATSDNPRTEDPAAILREVAAGLVKLRRVEPAELDDAASSYTTLVDRRAAIELALAIARPDDTLVIAGKGHEDYQIVGRERLPFDDRQEALRVLRRRALR